MNTQAIIDALIERQAREGWSDRAMARRLGINHTTWRGIKIGRQAAGVSVLERAVAAFPEYAMLMFRDPAIRASA
jgi:transcriptional regulator with XRE-family HTH domain